MFTTVAVLLLLLSLQYGSAEDYYVTSREHRNSTCPTENCHTLEYYTTATGANLLSNQTNVRLYFLEGVHTSGYYIDKLHIKNTESVLLTSFNSSQPAELLRVDVNLYNITYLDINHLHLLGGRSFWSIQATSGQFSKMVVQNKGLKVIGQAIKFRKILFLFSSIAACPIQNTETYMKFEFVTLLESCIDNRDQDSNGCPLKNPLYLTFTSSSIINRQPKTSFIEFPLFNYSYLNIVIESSKINGQLSFSILGSHSNLNINITTSSSNSLLANRLFNFTYTAGINSSIGIYLDRVSTENKLAESEGTFVDFKQVNLLYCCDFIFVLRNSTIIGKMTVLSVPIFHSTYIDILETTALTCRSKYTINITNTKFKDNSKCLYVRLPSNVNIDLSVNITESEFISCGQVFERLNQGIKLSYPLEADQSSVSISLEASHVSGNVIDYKTSGVIILVKTQVMLIKNCLFTGNIGTVLVVVSSNLIFEGHNVFSRNSGSKGGAIALHYSTIYMGNYSTLLFANNTASEVGGAIYVEENEMTPYNTSVTDNLPISLTRKSTFTFIQNFAKKGGDNVYGTGLRRNCKSGSSTNNLYSHFKFITKDAGLSSVTSNPTRVCLCDEFGIPQCLNMTYIFRDLQPIYVGEHFAVPVVLVGNDLGTVQGVVYSNIIRRNNSNTDILENQYIQSIHEHRKCNKLNLTIQSNEGIGFQQIQLTVGQTVYPQDRDVIAKNIQKVYKRKLRQLIDDELQRLPVILNVSVECCPPGFNLTKIPPYFCYCHYKLVEKGVSVCVIANHTGLVYRSGTTWISAIDNHNESNSFVFNQYCPYDYCSPDNISIDLRSPDSQCAHNHSGVLCGGCKDNHSLALGSSRCLPCNNHNISLLTVFILAGIILVLFIKALDLTVARGTINGLIFFANIVWTNKSILFPTPEPSLFVFHILQTFIAWLNLDLGIETCFFDGLDAYWKTWIQFYFQFMSGPLQD